MENEVLEVQQNLEGGSNNTSLSTGGKIVAAIVAIIAVNEIRKGVKKLYKYAKKKHNENKAKKEAAKESNVEEKTE